ncbi:helicase-associated domain-containing protein [Microbacterium deminutum]|uniref:Helicase XPB/Ssl2 N-terminal domain-containing protein n=1 Tax=Microbacterium deminutum TaxID=344164 RepID=A0ABP5CRQ2_9MICO
MVSDERALASWLAERDDLGLARILADRGVPPTVGWHDFFDAAAGLLDGASLDRALIRLPRRELVELADDGDVAAGSSPHLVALALIAPEGTPFRTVTERLSALLAERPDAVAVESPVDPPPVAGDMSVAADAERAFTTSGALADVLLACLHTPLSRTGTGAISAADRKRLTEVHAVASPEELEDLVESAAGAGLIRALEREWVVTTAGERWLESATPERWKAIAEGFRAALPAGLRTAWGGFIPAGSWAGSYPLDPEWPAHAARLRRIAELWGFLDAIGSEPPWTVALRAGVAADPTPLAAHLPAEIDRVYLQADLTAIAPGPLAPHLDLRLRGIARRESRAQASTYRFTVESLGAGMTEGETARSIREFLAQLSLTGIPQPLDYLIESTATRHGLVRVRADASTTRTRVESPEPGLLDTIAVDQALRPLGLVHDDGGLTSRVARDAVYWSLADARYPVVALGASGSPESLHRRAATAGAVVDADPRETYSRLIAVLRAGHRTDGEAAWLGRELEQAVRARAEIVVVVKMPDGSERSLTLEAAGLGGGRLRGRDRMADIERTLPVTSIVSVRRVS